MNIAIDAMGGDHAPDEIVAGALRAANEFSSSLTLVGDEAVLRRLLSQNGRHSYIRIHHASETIQMGESPLAAIRKKKDASICVAVDLVARGEAQAVLSAGDTGAAMAAATLKLGRLAGIDRPAIATVLPTVSGHTVLLDAGANVDCKPSMLAQFAVMGSIYAQCLFNLPAPQVGLLSIGEEDTKGNEVTKAAFKLLSEAPINFVGNVEGRDVGLGTVDVVVCDGFVGNILLKVAEGYAQYFVQLMREELTRSLWSKIAAHLLKPAFQRMKQRADYSEYGGALLLGVNGVCIIAHGSSQARAIASAVRVAQQMVEANVVQRVRDSLLTWRVTEEESVTLS
jgi:glycerol-3-phosphate acyltransferase PlsX